MPGSPRTRMYPDGKSGSANSRSIAWKTNSRPTKSRVPPATISSLSSTFSSLASVAGACAGRRRMSVAYAPGSD